MKIAVKLTKQDFLDFNRYAVIRIQKSKPSEKLLFLKNLVLWLIIGVLFMLVFQLSSSDFSNLDLTTAVITAAPFILLIVAFIHNQNKVLKLLVPREDGVVLGDKTLELKEDGIYETSDHGYGHSFYHWKIIDAVEEHNGSLYVFFDNIMALIIPEGSIGDGIDDVKSFIRKKASL